MQRSVSDIKKTRGFALLAFLMAVLFWVVFDFTKHNPIFADINPFANDPFDAVGSFGVLLAPVAALLALLGCFQPHPHGFTPAQLQRYLNQAGISLLAVIVSLLADAIALLRAPSAWSEFSAGWMLVGLLLIFLPILLLAFWRLVVLLSSILPVNSGQRILPVLLILLISSLALALFPDHWLKGVPGALFAVVFGMAFLFNSINILAETWLRPLPEGPFEDVLDDLLAVYTWKKARFTFAAGVFAWLEKLPALPVLKALLHWFNPRKHPGRLLIFLGIGLSVALMVVEMLAEGLPVINVLVLVIIVRTGILLAGILLAYRILNRFLGLVRRDPLSS